MTESDGRKALEKKKALGKRIEEHLRHKDQAIKEGWLKPWKNTLQQLLDEQTKLGL